MWHGVAGEVLGYVMSSRETTGITVVWSLRVQVLAAAETKNSNTGSGSRGAHSASSSSNTTGRSGVALVGTMVAVVVPCYCLQSNFGQICSTKLFQIWLQQGQFCPVEGNLGWGSYSTLELWLCLLRVRFPRSVPKLRILLTCNLDFGAHTVHRRIQGEAK